MFFFVSLCSLRVPMLDIVDVYFVLFTHSLCSAKKRIFFSPLTRLNAIASESNKPKLINSALKLFSDFYEENHRYYIK